MLDPGAVLQNRYEITRLLAQGGMGAVYLARDRRLGSTIALKETFFGDDDRLLKAFEREARLLANLRHAALPKVMDHFAEGKGQFLVMEFIPGQDLMEMLERRGRAFSPEEVLGWADQLLGALEYLHRQEPPVIHWDIKPHNLKLAEDGQIVLLDFGLAKGAAWQMSRVTTGSSIFGYTPSYAPLEQMRGTGTDARSDLYSLGATLYHLITGETPIDALTRVEALADGRPDPLRPANELNAKVTPDIAAVLIQAMALNQNRRFADAASMRKALREGQSTIIVPPRGLLTYEFETVKVDAKGKVTERRKGQARYISEDLGGGVTLEMVEIPEGKFLMGAPDDEEGRSSYEGPQHQVSVPTFYMGKYEVTQAQWRAVAGLPKVDRDLKANPSNFKGDNLPVEQVSWEDAIEFCARLSNKTGKTYRLPSEAEWEYACRAGTTTPFAFGETITPELVNYDGNYPYGSAPKGEYRLKTTPVGSLGVANGFGLYDMHGNVWEWCADPWHENYNGAPGDGSIWEVNSDKSYRVLRGGSWNYLGNLCRSAYRNRSTPDYRNSNLGFRVVVVARTR